MLILIDNYDSFTHIIALYFKEQGTNIKIFKNNEISVQAIKDISLDGIIFSPGPGRPNMSGNSYSILAWATENRMPVLGICLGHQIIGEFFGATINYAQNIFHGKYSHIKHNSSRLFTDIKLKTKVARYHSLVILEQNLPHCINVTARTTDKTKEIMAIEHKTLPIFGIQFHPESILTENGKAFFTNFIRITQE